MKYSVQRQITVALENVPGRLAAICEILSAEGVNIEGICVVDNVEQDVVRLLTNHPPETKRLLAQQQLYVVEADVLVVELVDHLGSLAQISAALASAKINIDDLYGSCISIGASTKLVFKVSDIASAQRILGDLS